MKKSVIVVLASLATVAVLVLASCGPSVPTTTPPTTPPPTTAPPTTAPPTGTPTSIEKPKYGGTLNVLQDVDILSFDDGIGRRPVGQANRLTNEFMLKGDWAKGPAGTGEVDFAIDTFNRLQYLTGSLAESWEYPKPGNLVFHIRKGVHWAMNPASEASRLVNGRELTVNDVLFSFQRNINSANSFLRTNQPGLASTTKASAPDKSTLLLEFPPDIVASIETHIFHMSVEIVPPEVIQKYGDMGDWHNVVGTGPFMLSDFVSGSAATLIRNPNYWDKDPAGPGKGNQLPYLDTVKLLIVTDISSRLAAIRTGRADWMRPVEWEDANSLMKTTPGLKYKQYLPDLSYVIFMRTDKPDLPFKDKRVRQALMMATDFESLKKELYGGQAETLVYPITKQKGYEGIWVPLEQMPQSTQDLFKYDPTKAKQLLADAGYPNGFKTKITVQGIASQVDPVSAIKAMWARVGVDLTIDPKEYGVYSSVSTTRSYDEMLYASIFGIGAFDNLANLRGPSTGNKSYINDPVTEQAYNDVQKYILVDQAKVDSLYRQLLPYVQDQAFVIPKPTPYSYVFWWPWIKNYHGEAGVNWYETFTSWVPYVWVDQDLKEQMTGRR
jgi:peptide/nickel transport system substrate-binding protein